MPVFIAGMSDVGDNLDTNAGKPRSVLIDGTQVVQHPLRDQIEAAKFIDGQAAALRSDRGFNVKKLKAGGTEG